MKLNLHKFKRLNLDLLILAIFMALNIAVYFGLNSRGIELVDSFDLKVSNSLAETGSFPDQATYPFGIGLVLYFITEILKLPLKAFIFFKSAMLAISLFFINRLFCLFSSSYGLSRVAVILVIFNPYFVWSGLSSRDFATEIGLMTGCLFFLIKAMRCSPNRWAGMMYSLGGVLLGIASILVRTTNFFILVALLLTFAFIYQQHLNKILVSSVLLIIFMINFISYNHQLSGQFTLTTITGKLVFMGNHPAYLHCHPNYDLECLAPAKDEFLRNKFPQNYRELNEAQINSALLERGLEFISSDPLAFLYRFLVKTQWHWFNLERVPTYTVTARWDSASNAIIIKDKLRISYSLVYLLYRIFYLPFFVATLLYIVLKKRWEWIPFIMPYIALWPIVVITFPDTRYKMIADTLAIIPMILFSFEVTQEAKTRLLKRR